MHIRTLLRAPLAALLLTACAGSATSPTADEAYASYYADLPVAIPQVALPTIADRSLNLADLGAVGDGLTLCTEAFRAGIDRLAEAGGGRLVVPRGIWLTAPIALRSGIELHIERGGVIMLTPDKRLHIDPEHPDGKCLSGIHAEGCHDIAITGEGIIDGGGADWYYVKRGKLSDVEWRARLSRGGWLTERGDQWYPWQLSSGLPDIAPTAMRQERRRADLVRLTDCERVLLRDVTVQNSPRFHIHPFYCRDLTIDGVSVRCPWNAQNGDGIDLTDCHRALIVRSTIDVGDDGICLKSDPPGRGSISGCEDIVVQDVLVRHAHGGFVLGSNTASGMRRIVVRACTYCETDTGLRFKSGIGRGGRTEQVYARDITMTDIAHEAIVFQCDYADMAPGETTDLYDTAGYLDRFTPEELEWTPDFQDIHIEGITCRGAQTAIKAAGLPGLRCVHDITIDRCTFAYDRTATAIDTATAQIALRGVRLVSLTAPSADEASRQ